MTEEELREHVRSMIGYQGDCRVTAKDLAQRFGISQAYLSDVLNGRRGIADKLAGALGFERVVTFEPKERDHD